jgi:3'-phosphoadenosine 5'-phosphosulfate sulfotransferase (PAPS reductase)/FAD synthetase
VKNCVLWRTTKRAWRLPLNLKNVSTKFRLKMNREIKVQPSSVSKANAKPIVGSSDLFVISFSGGRTSAFMCLELLKDDKYKEAAIIFSNTGKEKEETLEFVNNVDKLIGNKIVWVEYANNEKGFEIVSYETASRKGEPFRNLVIKKKFCPNIMARFCTQELKIRPMKKYCQKQLGWKNWTNLVGIRYDEPHRYNKVKSVVKSEVFDVEHPLVKWKITKTMVLNFWQQMPFDLQLKDYEGNCDLCFLKGKKKKQQILRDDVSIADWWIETEQIVNGRFVKDYSYKDLRKYLLAAPEFSFDDTIECFCNVD